MTDAPKTDMVARDQRRAELAQLEFSPAGQLFVPKDGKQLLDMANMMSTAGFMVKDIYRDNPGACLGLIAICAPYGLNPLQVSWKTYRAAKGEDAPIAFEAQVIVAMVNASGAVKGGLHYAYEGEGDQRICIASGTIAGSDDAREVRSPPIGKITTKNSPLWKSDPDQQLAYYTGRSWARRYKPEMLLGVYDVDELSAPPIRDITPKEGGFVAKAQAARQSVMDATEATVEPEAAQDVAAIPDAEIADPAPEPHWTDAIDTDAAFPGSEAWESGVKAAKAGMKRTMCPHQDEPGNACDWLGGFDGQRRAEE